MASTLGGSVAQLLGGFRHAVRIGTARRKAIPSPCMQQVLASSSRSFRTNTAHADDATSPSSAVMHGISDAAATEQSAGAQAAKPKRRRRSREEIDRARMAKLAFGLPMKSKKRSRTALGGVAEVLERTTQQEDEQQKTTVRRGRPKVKAVTEKELEKIARMEKKAAQAAAAAAAAASTADIMEPEVMEKLLSQMQYHHLPPRDEWKEAFPNSKQHQTNYRYFLSNRETIKQIIPYLGITDPERNGEKVTVIEGYPGPGTVSSELLKMPEVEKLIALEATPRYVKKLELLKEQAEKATGQTDRLDIVRESAYYWDTYNQLVSSGKLAHLNGRVYDRDGSMLDLTRSDFAPPPDFSGLGWQNLSPMIFFAQLPNTVYGEQLFAQILSAIATRSWLFRFGRIKLGFICGESLAKRCIAEAGDKISRGKLGTTVQCLADIEVHRHSYDLAPHEQHFFPPSITIGPRVTLGGTSIIPNSNPSTGLSRTGIVMMTVTPKKQPLVQGDVIEAFEFITRNLFILRTKPVGQALTHVAPGGQNVLKMTGPEQVEKGLIRADEVIRPDELVCDLTNAQWACLARMFEKWPFRPKHLFEEGRIQRDKKHRM